MARDENLARKMETTAFHERQPRGKARSRIDPTRSVLRGGQSARGDRDDQRVESHRGRARREQKSKTTMETCGVEKATERGGRRSRSFRVRG